MSSVPDGNEAFWNRVRLRQTVRDIALLFALAGGIAALAALVALFRAQAVASWPTVPGVVVSSGLESRPIAGRIVRFEPVAVVRYAYTVDGLSFTSETVTQGAPPAQAGTAEAMRLLATYPVDAPVTVFHNPRDPAQAVLEQEVQAGTPVLLLLLFGLAVVFGVLALFLRPRSA